jgi:ribosomal protein S18 acetylase RimI-like enzyme
MLGHLDVVQPLILLLSGTRDGLSESPWEGHRVQPVVSLRPTTDADRGFLYAVYASTRMDELAPLQWDDAAVQSFLTMQFNAQDHHYRTCYDTAQFLIVVVDGQPAGRLYVARRPKELLLMEIALLPAYRSAGIGTALIRDLMEEARSTGRIMRLHVEPFNPALRLYQRLGFSKVSEAGVYWLMEWIPAGVATD